MIKAIVGAGGKSSLIKKLAKEYRAQGKRVLVCTTTHMYKEEDSMVDAERERILHRLMEEGYAMAGSDCGEKIGILPDDVYEALCSAADVVLVEADGARHKSIKFPAAHEPVIPDNCDEIIVICSLYALGQPLSQAAHRVELAAQCLGISEESLVCAKHIETLLKKGYVEPLRQRYPEKQLRIHANHDGSLYQRALAALLEAEMDVSLIHEEWFQPQPRLFISGGGHVAKALAVMANCLDLSTVVMDDREECLVPGDFPKETRLICDCFEHLEQYLQAGDYHVVVTRGHKDDLTCVEQILHTRYAYLGMIGSKKKVATAFQLLRQDGYGEDAIDSIHAPIGLDIGAVTPAEIAVSILAEVIQVKNQQHKACASRELLSVREEGVLCIIIGKKGSSPRGVGSMMFVAKEGIIDSIGGGAVEFAAIDAARKEPVAAIRSYNLNKKEENALDMVCGGSNDVLFLPLK